MKNSSKKTRLLYLAYERKIGEQKSRRRVFKQMLSSRRIDGLTIYPYQLRADEVGWKKMFLELIKIADEFQPTIIYWQHMVHGKVKRKTVTTLRELRSKPVICSETGDAFGNYWKKPFPRGFINFSKDADITFLCGLGRMKSFLKKKGVKRIALLPNFCDPEDIEILDPDNYTPEYDVVMIANNFKSRRPFANMPGHKKRISLVNELTMKFGKRFAVFGKGWEGFESARGPVDFFKQFEIYHKARVGIGCANFLDIDYYESNRLYIAIASGVSFVSRYVPKIDNLLVDKKHCFFYRDNYEAIQIINSLLKMDESKRIHLALDAAKYVRRVHCADKRMEYLLKTMENMIGCNPVK